MKEKIRKHTIHYLPVVFIVSLFVVLLSFGAKGFAEDDEGVSGCNAVQVDPNASLEDQQSVCSTAEQFLKSSCAIGGHGACSAPKTDGTLMDGKHCVCLSQTAVVS